MFFLAAGRLKHWFFGVCGGRKGVAEHFSEKKNGRASARPRLSREELSANCRSRPCQRHGAELLLVYFRHASFNGVTTHERFFEIRSAKRFAVIGIVDIVGSSNIKNGRSAPEVLQHAAPAPEVRHIIV